MALQTRRTNQQCHAKCFKPPKRPVPNTRLGALNYSVIFVAQTLAHAVCSGCHHEAHDKAIEAKRFGKDENEDDAHEDYECDEQQVD